MEDVCEIVEEFVEVRIGGGGCELVVFIRVIWTVETKARGTRQ